MALCRGRGRGNLWEVRTKVVRQRKRGVRLALQPSTEEHCAVLLTERGNPLLNLWAEVTHQTLNRPCRGIAQGTDGAALNLFAAIVN